MVLTDVDDAAGEALADSLGTAEYRHHDVGDEDGWRELVTHIESAHGRIDVLVNNAGARCIS